MEIPSKYDIIPIHTSDRGTFKRCRRAWNWKSPSRNNLTRKVDVFGIDLNLWFGTGIHFALEHYYNPSLKQDPVAVWLQWFDIQYHGGTLDESWLKLMYDPKPQFLGEHAPQSNVNYEGQWDDVGEPVKLYKFKGLEVLLPYEDRTDILALRDLGQGMMEFYKDYAQANDTFEVLNTEHEFSVPIWDFDNDRILTAVDIRPNSPNEGKTLEVHYRGRMDLQKVDGRKYGVADHKTTSRIDEDYFRKLELDEQCTSYLWASEIEASYYGLPWAGKKFDEVLYQALYKRVPSAPKIISNGQFSIDRKEASTPYSLFKRFLDQAPHWQLLVETSDKHANYVEWLKEVGDEMFIVRKSVTRNRAQLQSAGKRIYMEAMDMLNAPRIYPNPTGDYACLNCDFRVPCIIQEDGGDYVTYIKGNYVTNKDR